MTNFNEAYNKFISTVAEGAVEHLTPEHNLEVLATCKCCGRTFTGPEWAKLTLKRAKNAPKGVFDGLEFRDCDSFLCKNTLAISTGLYPEEN